MKILLLGAPGAGKGTQAQVLMKEFAIPQLSTGDILRAIIKEGSELGKKVEGVMKAGGLVNNELISEIIRERVKQEDCKNGYLLDGFPRNLEQVKALEEAKIDLDVVIEFAVDDSVIVERITGRRSHPSSGRVYHVKFNPPQFEGLDDETKEPLVLRDDDREEIVLKRLDIYHEQTKPLLDYYSDKAKAGIIKYIKIDGTQSVDLVSKELIKQLQDL